MSKLTHALVVIKNECDDHLLCNSCPLRYKDDDGHYGCILDNWGITSNMRPRDWPIDEVREVEHEK